MKQQDFQPYIPADKVVPEMTVVAIVLGSLLSILFGGANAYLGLRVGMTVSASIPAAVLSMGIIRFILNRDSILENNMVQTIGSAGESLAAGAIFTLPALFMWAIEGKCPMPTLFEIGLIGLCGGILGVLFMVPLRNALIVKEHGTLAYPEGHACAEVLIAGEEGGTKASTVFAGLGISAAYKFIADGLKIFPSEVAWDVPGFRGAGFGIDVLPALLGVGYIVGPKLSSYIFAGGITAWFILMPIIALFGGETVLFPATVTVNELLTGGTAAVWSKFIRYIGAGAVLAGGIMSLVASLPLIWHTFKGAMGVYGKGAKSSLRTEQDLSMQTIFVGLLVTALVIWLAPTIPLNLFSTILVVIFGFFFAAVSSRMVGLIGSSNNPISGMTIATLLISTVILKANGNSDMNGMMAAITIGGIICVIAAIAGDTSQDLKTGFLVGATPRKQQIGEIIGVIVSALAIGGIMYLLSQAWGYGSPELPSPQAVLMKMVVEGVMVGNLPWPLVITGIFIAIMVRILGVPVLPFAIGLYLPIYLSVPIMIGGLIRGYLDRKYYTDDNVKNSCVQSGILYTSGLIAGEGMIGIILAIFAVMNWQVDMSKTLNIGKGGAIICFGIIIYSICYFADKARKQLPKHG